MSRVLVTSALPYIHGMPHLGNLVGSVLPGDVFSRYLKLSGKDHIYICGSDAHGTSYEVEAIKRGISPEQVVKEYHEKVQEIFKKFNLDFTYYGSTHTEQNREITYRIFKLLDESGYLEEQESEVPYCPKDGMFLFDRLVEGECPLCGGLARGDQCDDCGKPLNMDEVINPHCKVCDSSVEFRKTKHLYLQLNKFQDWISDWYSKDWSSFAVGETKSWLQKGLKPRRITGDTKWGFPVPKEGYEDKVFYVWFDAPIGYIGITKEWADQTGSDWERWWLPESSGDVRYVQFMGKDNVFFHSIMFPSYLHGSDPEWKQVDDIYASGWLLSKDVKFSKSRGTGLSAEESLDIAPADVWRFVLMSLYPESDDTEFSWDEFQRKVNNELADNVGNFINRVLTYTKKNFVRIPQKGDLSDADLDFDMHLELLRKSIASDLENGKLRQAINGILAFSNKCNAYLNQQEPWKNSDELRVKMVLNICCHRVAELSVFLHPYIPESTEKIWRWIGLKDPSWDEVPDLSGNEIGDVQVLFKKFDDDEIAALKEKYASKEEKADPFSKIDLRVAEIKSVEEHPDADKLYVIQLDVGEKRQIVSGLRGYYTSEELVGKRIVLVSNLEKAKIRGVESQGMLLAAESGDTVKVLEAEGDPGDRVYIEGVESDPSAKIGIKEFAEAKMEVTGGTARYSGKELRTERSIVRCNLDKGSIR